MAARFVIGKARRFGRWRPYTIPDRKIGARDALPLAAWVTRFEGQTRARLFQFVANFPAELARLLQELVDHVGRRLDPMRAIGMAVDVDARRGQVEPDRRQRLGPEMQALADMEREPGDLTP